MIFSFEPETILGLYKCTCCYAHIMNNINNIQVIDIKVLLCYNNFNNLIDMLWGENMKKIVLKWKVAKVKDSSRVSSMYCFKNCDKNQN